MIRETFSVADSRSHMSVAQQTRIVDNTRLSALTNQIMELVLDNINLVHMNSKLLEYCKRQTHQTEKHIRSLEQNIEQQAASTVSEVQKSSQEVNQVSQELNAAAQELSAADEKITELEAKIKNLNKLNEHERMQYQRSIREKTHEQNNKLKDSQTLVRAHKQEMVRLEMDKQRLAKEKEELADELNKSKAKEKQCKQKLQEEQLKSSKALQNAMYQSKQATAAPLDYNDYLAKRRGESGMMITGKVGMSSKFMDMSKLNGGHLGGANTNMGVSANRRSSVLSNPL